MAGAVDCAQAALVASKVMAAPAIKVRDLKDMCELLFKLKKSLFHRTAAGAASLIACCCLRHILLASDTFSGGELHPHT
jgi:hypothetical protein